jgi:hypothetical protein
MNKFELSEGDYVLMQASDDGAYPEAMAYIGAIEDNGMISVYVWDQEYGYAIDADASLEQVIRKLTESEIEVFRTKINW